MIQGSVRLAEMLQQSRAEIGETWLRLLATRGLQYQQHRAREDPVAVLASFDQLIESVIISVAAADLAEQRDARERLIALYRRYGRQWAEQEGAEPAEVLDPPRVIQAVSHVILKNYGTRLPAEELLEAIAALSALGTDLTTARVYGYMSYKEEVLRAQKKMVSCLVDELVQVETKERRALALELHDSLAQRLVSLFSGIQHSERLITRDIGAARVEIERLRRIAQATIRDARAMIRDLHFGITSPGGGFASLGEYIRDLEADTGIRHHYRMAGRPVALAPAREALAIRIIQEALINAHRHASARRIDVMVEGTADALVVTVRDNGRGFQVEEALARTRRRGRFGLIGMRERANLLSATLEFQSSPSQGTVVRLTVPHVVQHE
jgi:signal transduction histidine kinase